MSTCSSTESLAALGYLRRSFTCYDLDQQAERSLLRTFQKFTSAEVMAALEELKSRPTSHWPLPAEIEATIRKAQRKRPKGQRVVRDYPRSDQDFGPDGHTVVDIPAEEFTPAENVHELVAELKDPESALRRGGP
jgi:hypothetical protein